MAETLIVSSTATKAEKYQELIPQLKALTSVESDLTANLANIAAALKYGMGFFWVGFYRVETNNSTDFEKQILILAPFQGPLACTRIKYGKGVCGKSWQDKATILVEDVEKFEGHIACSSDSKSEIVVPVFDKNGNVALILDVDSDKVNDFDETDKKYLEELMKVVEGLL
ncbi:GAF domain-containing protein [Bernardetia litoralis DSM 6794]|uniref:GAF domain-containing protein n=1 Tax=Bernardetia litoralis (strain ATCC 23117 / DSM 6794 / NBRC 15988 / NCIMB 1366 / Fx l1 / Sio-4) TaxID=880071 RepID=I4AIQ2_BERLS|nr:GAF domain-containing protein [Bernardetia litoralis]AFM03837.1 GAF domain-containing protein [Bernardetia litoralis DSM 6794]